MKEKIYLALPLATGALGFLSRWAELRLGFDGATGLATGHIVSTLLPLYLAAAAVLYLAAAWRRGGGKEGLSAGFETPQGVLPVLLAGVLLTLAGGGLMMARALQGDVVDLLLGALSAVSGCAMFAAVWQWRRETAPGNLLLAPVLQYVVWLLLTYKDYADYPVTARFYTEVLALAALALAAYQAGAFAFGQGSRRMFAFSAAMAVTLGCTALADGVSLPLRLLYGGAVLQVCGLWLCQRLGAAPAAPEDPADSETAEDGGAEQA